MQQVRQGPGFRDGFVENVSALSQQRGVRFRLRLTEHFERNL